MKSSSISVQFVEDMLFVNIMSLCLNLCGPLWPLCGTLVHLLEFCLAMAPSIDIVIGANIFVFRGSLWRLLVLLLAYYNVFFCKFMHLHSI